MADRLSRLPALEKMPPSGTCHHSPATVSFSYPLPVSPGLGFKDLPGLWMVTGPGG